ncbi:hypothetical protein [Crenobacter cavernae]|uniref:Uncharacterized protein n=1 Tax=Crenobacter cavernae TaxID=2290923 RepID=A0A345Y6S6_9NEIS|nr:hypothetical protein [Crenobacter cavernae]AXK39628.1 hypothetical protein DWG20_09325 [Crenobacter cavernae]
MPVPSADLTHARDCLAAVRAAQKAYLAGGNAVVKEYRIKDRVMTYRDSADLLQQVSFWQREVARLEAAEGFRPNQRVRVSF